jgi:hypothetical protein
MKKSVVCGSGDGEVDGRMVVGYNEQNEGFGSESLRIVLALDSRDLFSAKFGT